MHNDVELDGLFQRKFVNSALQFRDSEEARFLQFTQINLQNTLLYCVFLIVSVLLTHPVVFLLQTSGMHPCLSCNCYSAINIL